MDSARTLVNEARAAGRDGTPPAALRVRAVREVGLQRDAEQLSAGSGGLMGAIVAHASDGRPLHFDGGDLIKLCAGCLRRDLVIHVDFSAHERNMPAFARRCKLCVSGQRSKLATAARQRREELIRRGRGASGDGSAPLPPTGLGDEDKASMTILEAVRGGHLDVVMELLARDPRLGRAPSRETGRSALHEALATPAAVFCSAGAGPEERYHIVSAFLEAGHDANARSMLGGERPLHFACQLDDARVVALLLAGGAGHSAVNALGRTPLHCARSPTVASVLERAGCDTTARDRRGLTPYAAAVARADESQAALDEARAAGDAGLGVLAHAAALDAQMMRHWERRGERSARKAQKLEDDYAGRELERRDALERQREERAAAAEQVRLRERIAAAGSEYSAYMREVNRGRAEVNARRLLR